MNYQTSDFRNGLKVEIDGDPYSITYFQFVKPGKGNAFTRTKLKNLISGNVLERTFRSGETIKAADCEQVTMQFQYPDGDTFYFMNMDTFEQVPIPVENLDGLELFLTDGIEADVLLFKDRPVSIELPNFIESVIVHCEPGVKGNTATGASKPATLECGATVQVPLFVEEGDTLKVDTRTREYVSRVGK